MRGSALIIETPEGVRFSYELATPVARGLAWVVDAAVIGMASYLTARGAQAVGLLNLDLANALGVILYFAISTGYGIVFEWRWRGQTIGKRVAGLRVIDAHGLRLQLSQIAVRNLLRAVDALPLLYLVGGLAAFFNDKCQRLGDLAANTVVTRERRREEPDVEAIASAKYNSLLGYPHLAARLRSLAEPEAVAIAIRAISRRDQFTPAARVELFGELADYFRSVVAFPEAAIEGLTDEQFVTSALRVVLGRTSQVKVASP